MIKFHPDPGQLTLYAQGGLSPTESIMVSAHCDMCQRCYDAVQQNIAQQAEQFEAFTEVPAPSPKVSQQFDQMLADILRSPQHSQSDEPVQTSRSSSIDLDGRRFSIPHTLQKFVPVTGNWASLVGRLWQAPVHIGGTAVANFIYMGHGGGIPEHTHRGEEQTLVLRGGYEDGINQYHAGDLITLDDQHTHAPHCYDPQGCLMFSILDQPLHFTSGIARLINPFSHVFFR